MWQAIDLEERPDLREELTDPEWLRWVCDGCGAWNPRAEPLMVIALSPEAPVILGLPDEALEHDSPMAPYQEMTSAVEAAVGPRVRDLPGPVVLVPFDVLVVAAARDVAADAANPPVADGLSPDEAEVARRYAVFLSEVRGSRPERRINLATNRLVGISSRSDLAQVFAEFPELSSSEVRQRLSGAVAAAQNDEERLVMQVRLDVARLAGEGRFDEGWARFEEGLLEISELHVTPRVVTLMEQLRAEEAGDARRAIAIGEELLSLFYGEERPTLGVEVRLRTAAAYYNAEAADLEDRLDRVIALCSEAVKIIDGAGDDEDAKQLADERVRALLNIGAAYGRRHRGDPVANHGRACDMARAVLDAVTYESDPQVWAMASTNLGMSLVKRAKERQSNDPARQREVDQAVRRFEDALRWRSLDRDPLDWAFTQIGLGLAEAARGRAAEAVAHHRESSRGFRAARAPRLEAQAWHNVASTLADLAETAPEPERIPLASEAADACRRALALRPPEADPVAAANTHGVLARTLELAGDDAGTMAMLRQALAQTPPETAPQWARGEALHLARVAARAGDLETEADAYELAVHASVAALEARADFEGRFEELDQGLNVFRWAASSLLRAGRVRRAVEVLELGRGRELAAWLRRDADGEVLREVDPELHASLVALRKQLEAHEQDRRAGRPADLTAAGAVQEAHAQSIETVRAIPGLERFGLAPSYEEIAGSVPDDEALVYLFSAPEGSAALIVRRGAEPEAVIAPQLTSGRVVRTLIRGGPDGEPVGGYLLAQAAGSDELDAEISALATMLGPKLLGPLAVHLEQCGVSVVCVVAAGLLGQVPLHALPWDSAGTCLVERFDVVSTPSALARRVCLQRAAERDRLGVVLAVGNPLPHPKPLRWAQEEARVVADALPSTETVLLIGEDATTSAVAHELPRARYAHLACHGSAALSPLALDSRLYFSHVEPLSGADLLELGTPEARLVVASACETAISPSYEAADEALSLGTVILGAGAAGAIASLWAVDDLATALLMSRFYEELREGANPARALRVAMLWVRDLRTDEALEYARARPALRGQAERIGASHLEERPFGAPSMWAAFVLSGA